MAKNWIDQFPPSSPAILSDGSAVPMPFLVEKSAGIVLAGLADLANLNRFLEPEEVRAVPLTPKKGLVLLFAMNYDRSSVGPYQELVIQVAASTRDHGQRPILSGVQDLASLASAFLPWVNRATDRFHRQTPFLMWKLFVTTEKALLAGRDIWGYPKDLASVNVNVNDDSASFVVTDGSGGSIVNAVHNGRSRVQVPVSIDMRMISPKTYKRMLSRGTARASARCALFNSQTDRFEVGQDSPWGRNLAAIEFSPLLWTVMPQMQAAFF